MAEQILRVSIQSFRGVPGELVIDFDKGRSLVALGDNGTGKSTIADAIEFYFTGQIQFLAREGRTIVHHQSGKPESALVEVETTGALGGRATLIESVRAARLAGAREAFMLSGRTLAEFVDKSKGEKWKYLFEILGLGSIDQLRLDLQQARNGLEGERSQAKSKRETAASALRPRCGDLSRDGLWSAIRECCKVTGTEAPNSLGDALKQDWSAAFSDRTSTVQRAAKFGELIRAIESPPPMPALALAKAWNATVNNLPGADITRVRLIEATSAHLASALDADECPVCGQHIKSEALHARIIQTLEELRSSSQALEGARRSLSKFADGLRSSWQHRREVIKRAMSLNVELPELPPDPTTSLQQQRDRSLAVDLDEVESMLALVREWADAAAKIAREAAPSVSPKDGELVNLVLLVSQGNAWLQAVATHERTERAFSLAEKIHGSYVKRLNKYVTDVLGSISSRVATIYERLHPNEELRNIGVETWGDKGIELAVDFHGIRQKPPHGVLSESHLNSLGIALFLAMAETFNEQLGFLVLDDVVNSFDVEHRGRLAELLAAEYVDRQLIVLTHDHLFFEHLRRRAPKWRTIEFTSWTYDEGPRLGGYEAGGLIEKARKALSDGDLHGGASKARRALEEILQEACEALESRVAFRRGFRNDRREAGELLISVRGTLRDAKALSEQLKVLLTAIEADLQVALNVEVHASTGWASPAELIDALVRIERLNELWTCAHCGTRTWTTGTAPHSRCRCGKTLFSPPG